MSEQIISSTVKVAYQGERGAFSEAASHRLLGQNIRAVAHRTFEEMFDSVTRRAADCAVVPIENSLAGSVHKNYDLMLEHDLTIIAEADMRIVHNLIAPAGVEMSEVRRVYSHPVALAQCERFLRDHPQMEASPAYDTAGSVKMVVERRRTDEAAIAGRTAATVYGARLLAEGIEDDSLNFTRFLLICAPDRTPVIEASIKTAAASAERKTSIVFRSANSPGALFRAIAAFALRDINLTKIESRPIQGRPWEYSFYLDLIGDRTDLKVERALAHLSEMTESIRVLGSYSSAGALN
jgi:prephenate dehydratase